MTITNINWDPSIEDMLAAFHEAPVEKQAEFVDYPFERYIQLTASEKSDYFLDVLHHCPALEQEFTQKFFHLPSEVRLPIELENTSDDEILDWLEDEYGFFVNGFSYKTDSK